MVKSEEQQKKRKGRSVQDLIGIKTFTKYGLATIFCYRAFILSRNLVRVKATDCKGNRHILSEPFPPNRLNTLLNLRFQG